jgi:hypothetical protein
MRDTPLVKEGDRIEPGQLVGYAGNTGHSTGPHLHYNINKAAGFTGYSNSNAINPLTYFKNYNPSGPKTGNSASGTRGGFTSAANYGYTGNVYNIEGLSPAEGSSLSTSMKGAAGKTRGSGDVGDFWYDSLFNNNNGIQTDIPPIDETKLMSDGTDTGVLQQFIQKYEIKSDNTDKTELLDKMSKMTFNVRAQRVEELLEELIEKVSGDKPDVPSSTNGTDTNLFRNNGIPEPITRLSKG